MMSRFVRQFWLAHFAGQNEREELISKMGEKSQTLRPQIPGDLCTWFAERPTSGTSLPLVWTDWLVGVSQLEHKLRPNHSNNTSYEFVFIHRTLNIPAHPQQLSQSCHPKSLSVSGHLASHVVLISYTLGLWKPQR